MLYKVRLTLKLNLTETVVLILTWLHWLAATSQLMCWYNLVFFNAVTDFIIKINTAEDKQQKRCLHEAVGSFAFWARPLLQEPAWLFCYGDSGEGCGWEWYYCRVT